MQYATGVITQTADDSCVVSVTIDGKQRLFSFSKTIFYTFGMKCDGSMANILEEGMRVDLCYKIYYPGRRPYVIAVWCGDRPDAIDDGAVVNLYGQGGRVSYCVDDENFLVQNNAGSYTVIIGTGVAYRDGRRLKNVGTLVTMDEEMMYDAIPFDGEHPSGASYQATCAWVGGKAPGVVDRFHLQSIKKCSLDGEIADDVHGIVVAIANDVVAVVEGLLNSDVVQILLFRSSFGVGCNSIRDVVDVGDHVSMRVGYRCMFSSRKQCFAVKSLKLCEEVGSVPKIDVLVPDTPNCVTEEECKTGAGVVRKADVIVPVETQNGVAGGNDKAGDGVTDMTNGMDCTKGYVGLTKHFNHVRNGTISCNSLLSDMKRKTGEKGGEVTETAVRNYVGLGVKSVKSDSGVKEVIEVAGVISTYSAVLQDGSNGKAAVKAVIKVTDSIRRNPVSDSKTPVNQETKNRRVVADEISPKPVMSNNMKPFASVKTGNVTDSNTDTKQARSYADKEFNVVADGDMKPRENGCKDDITNGHVDDFAEMNRELDITNNNDVTGVFTKHVLDSNPVSFVDGSITSSDPPLLYCDPPLKGVISRFSLDCGSITFKHFKIFVKPDNFYIDSTLCPVKHFVRFAKPGKSVVNFEAVSMSAGAGNSVFTHESTCAWLGNKPSLTSIIANLPPPKFSLLEPEGQDFCGVVSKLYLPEYAFLIIPGDATTVVVHVSSFVTKPQYSDHLLGKLITNYVKLNDNLTFKVKEVDSTPKYLVAWNVRTTKHLTYDKDCCCDVKIL